MSKRDEDSQSDIEVGMTTAERRRRRRRGGGLRVPSDNVPRRNTSPPVVAPVPEDPALAMSIAYSFTSDGSEPVPRISAQDLANDPATSTGPFAPIAPDAATTDSAHVTAHATHVDPADDDDGEELADAGDAEPIDEPSFETKTREMSAVDLDALGLSELAASGSNHPQASSPPPAAGSPASPSGGGSAFSVRVSNPSMPAASASGTLPASGMAPASPTSTDSPPSTSGAFRIRISTASDVSVASPSESSVSIDPSLYGGIVESVDDADIQSAPVRPSDVDIDVDDGDGVAETTLDTPAEAADADAAAAANGGIEPVTSRAATAPSVRAQTVPPAPPPLPRTQTTPPPMRAQTSPPVLPSATPSSPSIPTMAAPMAAPDASTHAGPPPTPSSPSIAPPPVAPSPASSSPGIVPVGAVTAVSMAAVTLPSEAALTGTAEPAAAPPVARERERFKTMALNEDDIEEVRTAMRRSDPALPGPAAQLAAAAAVPQSLGRNTEPLSIPDIEVQELAERSEGSGEILVDVEDADEVKPRSAPPMPPPEAPRRPSSVPPPLANPTLANAAAMATAATQPLATTTAAAAAHASPPPPPPATAKAPPAPPPTKKVATPPARVTNADAASKASRGKPWFVDLFDEDYLRTLPFLTPQATQAEAEFVMDAMGLAPGAQVLDVGCGYGRHAMELAARGMHVVGLDLSTPLLVRGGEEAHRRGLTINFIRGDMRELDFDGQFDGAYCLFSTFGYFDDETNKKTAANIARALRPGGKVLIEILNRDYVIADLPTRVWWEGDGCVVLEEVELNYFSSRIQVNRSVVFDDGRQLEQEISVRAYSLHEVGKLMHSAGFRVLEVSGGYQTRGRFFGNQSRHIIVLAERTATPAR